MFLNLCHFLNRAHLSRPVAAVRFVLRHGLQPLTRERSYGAGSDVPGYAGWIEAWGLGVLAFRRTDGTLQYRW